MSDLLAPGRAAVRRIGAFQRARATRLETAVEVASAETLYCYMAYRQWPAKTMAQILADAFIDTIVLILAHVARGERVQIVDPWRWPEFLLRPGRSLTMASTGSSCFKFKRRRIGSSSIPTTRPRISFSGAIYSRLVDDLPKGNKDQLDGDADDRLVITSETHGYLPAVLRQVLTERTWRSPTPGGGFIPSKPRAPKPLASTRDTRGPGHQPTRSGRFTSRLWSCGLNSDSVLPLQPCAI
jgi:hypothetical protein